MDPNEVYGLIDVHRENKREEINTQLSIAWYNASLSGLAFNEPKKFPKKPFEIINEKDKDDRNKLLALKLESMFISGEYS